MQNRDWLPPVADDFKTICKQITEGSADRASLARVLHTQLDVNQCTRLMKAVCSDAGASVIACGFAQVKLGIVSNSTQDLLVAPLFIAGLRRGVWLNICLADFDQAWQESQSVNSKLCQFGPDFILINQDYRGYPFANGGVSQAKSDVRSSLDFITQVADGFLANAGVPCIVQNLALPPANLLGNFDIRHHTALSATILAFNQQLAERLSDSPHYLLDVFSEAAHLGGTQWFDQRSWLSSRIALSEEGTLFYCERVAALVGAIKGKSRKCLVLDLDNTLWGGVIGDDGLYGIAIQPGTPRGEAHLRLQQLALELKQAGIILAVCSKNDEKNALEAFQAHPDMLLKETDIAVFVANWQDKPTNLQFIATTLNIGIDALVFVDDNPAEREIVRTMLPDVAVPEMGRDPSTYADILMRANYFESLSQTEDDLNRADQYRANAARSKLQNNATDMQEYLRSLEMVARVEPFLPSNIVRVTQLVNKTNQFNLTTKRYTQDQIERMAANVDMLTLSVRLADRFGDNGLVSVVICHKQPMHWEIDSWLMSCRVIKRDLEHWICDYLVEHAITSGINQIIARYLPTEKNVLVENLLPELGFCWDEQLQVWSLDTRHYQFHRPPISKLEAS